MSVAMEMSLWFGVGFLVGMLLMAYASWRDRVEIERKHDEAMNLAKKELDQKEQEIDVLERENYRIKYITETVRQKANELQRECKE